MSSDGVSFDYIKILICSQNVCYFAKTSRDAKPIHYNSTNEMDEKWMKGWIWWSTPIPDDSYKHGFKFHEWSSLAQTYDAKVLAI